MTEAPVRSRPAAEERLRAHPPSRRDRRSPTLAVPGLVLLAACASPGPVAERQPPPPFAGEMCAVEVENGTSVPLEASYWKGAVRTTLGMLDPQHTAQFALPCADGTVVVAGALPGRRGGLVRARPSISADGELEPGKTTRLVLRMR